jgi:hypothetical protein
VHWQAQACAAGRFWLSSFGPSGKEASALNLFRHSFVASAFAVQNGLCTGNISGKRKPAQLEVSGCAPSALISSGVLLLPALLRSKTGCALASANLRSWRFLVVKFRAARLRR